MTKSIILIILTFLSVSLFAENYEYKFRLTLKDKGETPYSIDKPEKFLSPKAIERRSKQNIKIDESDLPISEAYLKKIEKTGGIIVAKSKWNGTVAVHCKDSLTSNKLEALPFVQDISLVWKGLPKKERINTDTIDYYTIAQEPLDSLYYGYAYDNIRMLKGDTLHARGFMGEGMTIGVIDGGFNNFPKIEFLDNINVAGYKNFVYENHSLFEQDNQHGTNVISCIATNKPHVYVGTAPNASFWMLGSEDSASEFPIEEDYWAAAIEFADSVGIDVVNSSLGYTNFDPPVASHTRKELDGKSTLISRSASKAANKGMFLVISAGNAGNKEWEKVSAPGDALDILTVGAIARDSTLSTFSSRGLTADLRIKPDVVALGSGSVVIDEKGAIALKSGTSFSSPITCGIVTCLWQAFPSLTNFELLDVIRESADRYEDPSVKFGFGIPDMEKAMEIAQAKVERKEKLKKR